MRLLREMHGVWRWPQEVCDRTDDDLFDELTEELSIERGNRKEAIPSNALENFKRIGNIKGSRKRVRCFFVIQAERLQLPSNIACGLSRSYCTSHRETPTMTNRELMDNEHYVSERHRYSYHPRRASETA